MLETRFVLSVVGSLAASALLYSAVPTWRRFAVGAGVASLLAVAVRAFAGRGTNRATRNLRGKLVVITGGNTGIGLETAVELAKMNATVIIGCRSEERAAAAVEDIKKRSGSEGVFYELVDLADLRTVAPFAARINALALKTPLYALFNNAGIMTTPFGLTRQGFEQQVGTNYIGHFALTTQLLPTIQRDGTKVVNVSSSAHAATRKFKSLREALLSESNYSRIGAYGNSKMLNILFSDELNRRLVESGSTARSNALHPGVVRTELLRYLPAAVRFMRAVFGPIAYLILKSPLEGAQTSLYVALDPRLDGVGGKFYENCSEAKVRGPLAGQRAELARAIWDETRALLDAMEKRA